MNSIFNNKWVSIFALLLLLANAVTLTLLWTKNKPHPLNPPPPPKERVEEFLINELQLSKEQQQKYQILIKEHKENQRPLQDSMKLAKEQFFNLLQQDKDTQIIAAANMQIARIDLQINSFNFNHFKKLRVICTPEQQKKFDAIIQKVLLRMGSQRQQPPPPPGERDGRRPPPTEREGPEGNRPPPPKAGL